MGGSLGHGEGGSIVRFQAVPLVSFIPSLQPLASPSGLRLHRQPDSHLILPINVSIGWGFLRGLLVTAVSATRWGGFHKTYIHDGSPFRPALKAGSLLLSSSCSFLQASGRFPC